MNSIANIPFGSSVLVPDPNETDIHNHEFIGIVTGSREGYAQVTDGDGDIFEIEPERLQIMDNLYVKDIDGNHLKVTDLNEAIKQAETFSTFTTDPTMWHNAEKKITKPHYWTHLLAQLKLVSLNTSKHAQTTHIHKDPEG